MFVLDEALPVYHGPISTSLEQSVAHSFSNETGLLWTIKPSYANKFKFVTGIRVDWISQHKNEEEVLLMNQYLPITSTINFDNDINNNVDHLLYSLKAYKRAILNVFEFYNIMGLLYDQNDINKHLIQIGIEDYVKLMDGRRGIIKFIGKTKFVDGEVVGLVLDIAISNGSDGSWNSKQYFQCPSPNAAPTSFVEAPASVAAPVMGMFSLRFIFVSSKPN